MAPLEGPRVYLMIPRLYRGWARRATAGWPTGGLAGQETSGIGSNWLSRAVRFRPIWPKTAGPAEPAVKYAANAC